MKGVAQQIPATVRLTQIIPATDQRVGQLVTSVCKSLAPRIRHGQVQVIMNFSCYPGVSPSWQMRVRAVPGAISRTAVLQTRLACLLAGAVA